MSQKNARPIIALGRSEHTHTHTHTHKSATKKQQLLLQWAYAAFKRNYQTLYHYLGLGPPNQCQYLFCCLWSRCSPHRRL